MTKAEYDRRDVGAGIARVDVDGHRRGVAALEAGVTGQRGAAQGVEVAALGRELIAQRRGGRVGETRPRWPGPTGPPTPFALRPRTWYVQLTLWPQLWMNEVLVPVPVPPRRRRWCRHWWRRGTRSRSAASPRAVSSPRSTRPRCRRAACTLFTAVIPVGIVGNGLSLSMIVTVPNGRPFVAPTTLVDAQSRSTRCLNQRDRSRPDRVSGRPMRPAGTRRSSLNGEEVDSGRGAWPRASPIRPVILAGACTFRFTVASMSVVPELPSITRTSLTDITGRRRRRRVVVRGS